MNRSNPQPATSNTAIGGTFRQDVGVSSERLLLLYDSKEVDLQNSAIRHKHSVDMAPIVADVTLNLQEHDDGTARISRRPMERGAASILYHVDFSSQNPR